MILRAETEQDFAVIYGVVEAAFGRPWEAQLVDRLRALPGFDPRLSLVAEAAGRIVGQVLFTPIRIRGASNDAPAVALAPVAVHPDHQRKGVGSALIRRGLEICRQVGHSVVIVLGEPAYYSRFDFVTASRFGVLAPFPAPDEAFMLIAFEPKAVLAGTVEYPPPFAEPE